MPVDLAVLSMEGRQLHREWKEVVKKHNSYSVKNKFHKERKMDEWNSKLSSINNHYRQKLKDLEKEGKMKKVRTPAAEER